MSIIKLSRFYHDEPPMYLQRPSPGRSQDVTHILASTFRDLFTRDDVEQEIVRNLNKSKSGDDTYHDKYVEELRKIQAERERRMAEALMLERHIMQARARSMAADERQLNKAAEGCDIYHELGLPPVGSNFQHCLDSELLKKHGLIVPEDFSTAEPLPASAPKASLQPRYAEGTETSDKHVEVRLAHQDQRHKSKHGRKPNTNATEGQITLPADTKKGHGQQWKEMTSPQSRELNRTDLAMVHKKSDFLRNPRHRPPSSTGGGKSLVKPNTLVHKLGGAKSTVIDTDVFQNEPEMQLHIVTSRFVYHYRRKEPSVVFLTTPSVVVFSDYQVGKVYEMSLDLKNVSAASRQVRIIPPKTQYFSVGLGKFPGEQGIVAPGMSCQYNVRFRPDSLKDFDDQITIQTQSSQPMVIHVLGRRPPPKLTLLPIIDCGHCLIGGQRIAEFRIKNEGGSGRFCIMPRESWPATNFKSVATRDRVDLEPFVIQPSLFELLAGHTLTLQITFTPTSIRSFNRAISIVCDNCTVKHFTVKGEGQTAGVELESVSGGESFPTPGEMSDSTAQHQIKFEAINPMTFVTKQMVIRNSTNVELPFNWCLLRPHLECQDPAEDDATSSSGVISRVADESNCFCINPDRGTLQPQGSQKATVAFAPTKIGSHHSVLHLILQGVPDDRQGSAASSVSSRSSTGSVVRGGMDVVGLEVEVKGECVDYDVAITPYAILVPGEVLVCTSARQQFQMINFSKFPINFNWSSLREQHIIEVDTPQGQIPAETTAQLELTISGGCPGLIDHTLLCHIEHQEKPLTLRVVANIKGPEVIVDTPSLDFGLVRFGEGTTRQLHIRNNSQVTAKWKVRESPEFMTFDPNLSKAVSEFTLTPSGGELPPLGSAVIDVNFKPRSCRLVNTVFECNIEDGKDSFVVGKADVQHPQVCLLRCRLHMEEVYMEVPVFHTVTLVNQAQLEADFSWGQPRGSQASTCEVNFDPSKGKLRPGEHLTVNVKFLSHKQGVLNDVQIPCHVAGMEHPVYLALSSDVKGLTVLYKIPKTAADNRFTGKIEDDLDTPLLLDFCPDVELGSTVTRQVIITNQTAITAPYNIRVERLPAAKPPTPPSAEDKVKDGKGPKRGLLSRTQNLADPKSRTPAQVQSDHAKGVLRGGHGAAFVVYPTSGILQPFSKLKIDVTAYSDMWGDYTDNLLCKIADLETVEIPIELKVTGCPLGFKMATLKGQLPIVRFGTHVAGLPPIQRPLQLRNNSPYDIRVDWQIFNIIPKDYKLLDLLVNFGNPFPLCNEQGEEIIQDEDTSTSRLSSLREAKDGFCNTPTMNMPATSEKGNLLSKITQELEDEQAASEIEAEERVISVRMRAHEGVPAEGPFSLSSNQMAVPARSCLNMSAAFTPIIPNLCINSGTDCIGYALGFMSLDKDDTCHVPGEVIREQGMEVAPLRLDFSAYIKPAFVTIETAEEEGMQYLTAASDLLQHPNDPALVPQFVSSQAATLTNATQTPLAFRIIAPHPFLVQTIDPRSKGKGQSGYEGVTSTREVFLPQQKNLQVRVAFNLTEQLLASNLAGLVVGETKDGCSLLEKGGERRLHIKKDLQLHYNNGSVQRLPLHAVVTIPSLIITPSEIDFGTCLVGQLREKEVVIRNHTGSASYWMATIMSARKSTESGVFGIVPNAGYLEAYVTHVSNSKIILKVQFTAKHNIPYDCKVLFQGRLGETPQELKVRGQGSYDSRHEALVNI